MSKAFELKEAGSIDQLQLIEVAKLIPSANEVIIEVKAISINPVDVKTRLGKSFYNDFKEQYHPIILGWDVSGIVESVGENVTDFKIGDAVFGMVNFPGHGKAYAEYVAAPASHLARKPEQVSHEEAAAATLAALTAYQVLKRHVHSGDSVLIHAAAGGVGHFAVQIAKILGAHVTGTTSGKNIDFVKSLGADIVIDYTEQPFENSVKNLDFALDALSGETLERTIQTVRKGGTIITLPSAGFNEAVVEKGKENNITIAFEMVESNGDDMRQIADWLQSGKLKATVGHTFPFEKLSQAHAQVETGKTRGKVIVTVP
ncbi:NADP-dependent oxidoreductase [Flavobacterium humi]|uniref:NADP-dependent oxidoreductase n=1 Tax=Flavobacterium humi TaxID=2562683 RepID=A0A4Z0L342_9FLAO|nr:NADP-dependent oxidoreductase [Flavobacterium humi]TGD56640.1 NADP-dependent oxidoreductase [Flavobacterium humi]